MIVKLINYTPNPEKTVAVAARMCYSSVDAEQISKGISDDYVKKIIRKIIEMGHLSPIEHASFTFSISGSRVMSHQLVRHRIASYSQKSQRYVRETGFEYITPPSIKANTEAYSVFKKQMNQIQKAYNKLIELGISEQDARFVLPNACQTNIICSFNARSLYNFFKLRCCQRAQWEIRQIADEMLKQLKEVAPVLFEKAGPSCVCEGYCPEGEKSCGRIKTLENTR